MEWPDKVFGCTLIAGWTAGDFMKKPWLFSDLCFAKQNSPTNSSKGKTIWKALWAILLLYQRSSTKVDVRAHRFRQRNEREVFHRAQSLDRYSSNDTFILRIGYFNHASASFKLADALAFMSFDSSINFCCSVYMCRISQLGKIRRAMVRLTECSWNSF